MFDISSYSFARFSMMLDSLSRLPQFQLNLIESLETNENEAMIIIANIKRQNEPERQNSGMSILIVGDGSNPSNILCFRKFQ
jgi:hypothetical protein